MEHSPGSETPVLTSWDSGGALGVRIDTSPRVAIPWTTTSGIIPHSGLQTSVKLTGPVTHLDIGSPTTGF